MVRPGEDEQSMGRKILPTNAGGSLASGAAPISPFALALALASARK